ncbi:hypothetical protein V5799_003808 [Amblyomma americanum]|uniref:Serpin domain-containing protein n=1 Tax=Amblyomma americanum TaxID=6943 RepID=A0AAQ4D7X1_AMBAM
MAGPLLQFPLDVYLRMRQEGGLKVTSYSCLYYEARVSVPKEFKDSLSSLDLHVHIQDFAESPEQSSLALDGFLRALNDFNFERDVFTGDSIGLDTFVVLGSVFFSSHWKLLVCPFEERQHLRGHLVGHPVPGPTANSFAVFLPAPSSDLVALEKNLNTAVILTCLGPLEQRGLVEVTLPRMKVKCLTDLKHYLPPIGVVDAFTNYTDFVNIARRRVSVAKHLALLRAGHRRPKTAAAQAAAKETVGAAKDKSVFKITGDRPFVLIVTARDTDTVLLLGCFIHVLKHLERSKAISVAERLTVNS